MVLPGLSQEEPDPNYSMVLQRIKIPPWLYYEIATFSKLQLKLFPIWIQC